MTRPQLIQEWRADLLTVVAWVLAIVVGIFVVLCCIVIGEALHTRRRRRQFKLRVKSEHIGRKS